MADQIKMNYPMMEDMAHAFSNGAEVLEMALSEVIKIASSLEDGGLVGDAGDTLGEACRGPLANAIVGLKEKLEEMQSDVIAAKEAMQTSDTTSKSFYQ